MSRLFDPGSPTARKVGWLLAELFVVFLGVWAAFLLDQYQADRRDAERRVEITRSLVAEMDSLSSSVDRTLPSLEQRIQPLLDSIEAGQRPRLDPVQPGVYFRPDAWNAALESGVVRLLEPATLRQVSRLYSAVAGLRDLGESFNANVRVVLLPNLGEGSAEFYGPDGSLRPKYAWYPRQIRGLLGQVRTVRSMADSAAAVLRREVLER